MDFYMENKWLGSKSQNYKPGDQLGHCNSSLSIGDLMRT